MLVKLTDKGRNTEEPAVVDFSDIFICLSDEEQQAFGEYLDRVIAALAEKLGYDDEEEFERMRAARERFAEMADGHFDRRDLRGMFDGLGRFARGGHDPHHDHEFSGFGHHGRGRNHEHD